MAGGVVRIAGKIVNGNRNISSTAATIPTTAATGRIFLMVKNNGANTVYLGDANVTTSNGMPLEPGDVLSFDLKQEVPLYGITASGSSDVRSLEGV